MRGSAHFAAMIAAGKVVNHYQPIVDLRSGGLGALEALGRLQGREQLIMPADFLPYMDTETLEALLFASLPQGLALLATLTPRWPELSMSFNVPPRVLLLPGFAAKLMDAVRQAAIAPRHVCIEILESDDFLDLQSARCVLNTLARGGIRLALDDIGIGYSSLARLQALPIEVIKLDQSFCRFLTTRPEDLHVIASMANLARGLNKFLVVEGVETPQIMDALVHLGVHFVQGFAIARPLGRAALEQWLTDRVEQPIPGRCDSLIAACAVHVATVEATRCVQSRKLRVDWHPRVNDPSACSIGRYLDHAGLQDTAIGCAHHHFHQVINRYAESPAAWDAAAEALSLALREGVRQQADITPIPVRSCRAACSAACLHHRRRKDAVMEHA